MDITSEIETALAGRSSYVREEYLRRYKKWESRETDFYAIPDDASSHTRYLAETAEVSALRDFVAFAVEHGLPTRGLA